MKLLPGILVSAFTVAVIVILNLQLGKIPPLGKFLSPQHGFWLNAEPAGHPEDITISVSGLKQPAEVFFDNRMVPHIFAANDHDAHFVQGYLHAKFRLWQMEFQTLAAGGRLSEILGPGEDSAFLKNDRNMRRMGMVYGAEQSLKAMEADPATLESVNAYTKGVNYFIAGRRP